MRNLTFFMIFGLIISAYAGLNYYIGLRGWQSLGRLIYFLPAKVYWPLFWVVALSYLGGRLGEKYLPETVSRGLTVLGAYWLAVMFYLVLVLVFVDIVRLLDRWLGLIPAAVKNHHLTYPAAGLLVIAVVAGIVGYGAWNARHPRVTHYDLTAAKQAGTLKELHIVMISDIHLGTIIGNRRLNRIVEEINKLHPDIVFLAGDVIDESVRAAVEEKMADTLRKLQPKLGTYAVLGNHEYIGGHAEEAVRYLEKAGIQVLRDRYVQVAGGFYVVGRDDRSGHMGSTKRKDLSVLLAGIDRSLPVILLDHQPVNLAEPASQGVDLQFSGHTHRGQLFPNHLITERIYEDDWGYLRKGNLQVIVSSGVGTWGPPIRTGSYPEIVDVTLHFKNFPYTCRKKSNVVE